MRPGCSLPIFTRRGGELKPVCRELLQAAGQGQQDPSFEDFLWAYSTFW